LPAEQRGLRYVTIALIAVGLLLGLKLVYIQVVRHGFYMRVAEELDTPARPDAVPPGRIYDAAGHVLADAQSVADLGVDPTAARTRDTQKLRQALVQALGLSPEVVDQKLSESGHYQRLASLVPMATVQGLRALQLPALIVDSRYKRVYPYGTLGAHVLGAYSGDQRPIEGLDLKYRFLLAGRPGTPRRNVDAWGRTIIGMEDDAALPSVPGKALVTTLDLDLQRQVESALDGLWSHNRPENATVVVMEPTTGAVLALASRPTYNPNDLAPSGAQARRPVVPQQNLRDLPVSWEYEPGSTFKVLTAAAALQYRAITMNSTFYCGGSMEVGGRPLHCWGKWAVHGHGSLNLAGILAQSCNLGAAQVAMRVGAQRFTQFLDRCGLGARTGVGLPGEAKGQVYPPQQLRIRDLANMGFGQHVLVTPLQLTAAICGIVNDGVYMQPQIVRRVLNDDGTVFREVQPRAKLSVCTPEVSRLVRQMMVGVVDQGTGRLAHIDGVAVGGKTGTAQVFDPAQGIFPDDQKVVSFVLIARADRRPDFCILVTAKNPQVGEHGADVCAPVAKDIALYLLRRRGLLAPGRG
jgi:stage V sporulation protein D (sporulation-specific penicillin-binding protein)